jgi:hypothetical protein
MTHNESADHHSNEVIQSNFTRQTAAPAPQPTYAGMTKAQVGELRAQYGEDRVKTASIPTGKTKFQYIVRAPSKADYQQYENAVLKAERNMDRIGIASRNLFKACLLAPTAEAVQEVWDAHPAIVMAMMEPILKMAGLDVEATEETF